jgi:enoyl-CoA hydratase/carnithine racemase
MNEVRLEIKGAVAEIVLNRPERKNSVTGPLAVAAREAIEAAEADPAVHVILLRGESGVFSSGLDLKEFNAEPKPEWLSGFQRNWRSLHERLFVCDKAVVCALEGYAINAGSALALSADYLIAGETSFLQVGEVRQGRPAPMNVAWLLARHSDAVARRVMLLGRRIAGPELLQLGIAHAVVPDSEVLKAGRSLASELAEISPEGIAGTKRILRTLNPRDASSWFDAVASAAAAVGARGGPIPSLKQ